MSRSLLQLATECRVDGCLFGFFRRLSCSLPGVSSIPLTPYSSPSKELS